MLKEIYYKLAELLFRHQAKDMGKGCQLRMSGRVIGGQYVHMGDGVGIEKHFILAVTPEYGGVKTPVAGGG